MDDEHLTDGHLAAGRGDVVPGPALREWARQAGLKPLDVPGPLRSARVRFGPRQFAALLLVVAVAALVLVGRVIVARSSSEVRPVAVPSIGGTTAAAAATGRASAGTAVATGAVGGAASSANSAGAAGAAGDPGASQVVVHVVGQVKHPGVVALPSGSRVLAAVEAAGGATPAAVLSRLNLARLVADGEQIFVPGAGDAITGAAPGAAGGAGAGGSAPGATKSSGPVNLNTATVAELDALPGIGPVLAARIVAWREEHGRFSSVDELGEVAGIGDKLFARLRPAVAVS